MTILIGDGGSQIVGSEQVLQPSFTAYGYNAWGILRGPGKERLGLGGNSPNNNPWGQPTEHSRILRARASDMIAGGR